MNIRKIIYEEIDDFEWIKGITPQLSNSVIRFEPMIDAEEYKKVEPSLSELNMMWSRNNPVTNINPFDDGDMKYLHHLIINKNNRIWYGGLGYNEYYSLLDDGDTNYDIMGNVDRYERNLIDFIEDERTTDNPRNIDGREFFDLPYNEPT